MGGPDGLVGREEERRRLLQAADRARAGEGSIVLVSGEAGVGKTSLVESVAAESGALVLRGAARHGGETPYGPVAAALRSHLRTAPDALGDAGPLREHLALILP